MITEINELDTFIGNKIRLLRKQRNVGLKYLSCKLGVSLQQLHKYETGVNKVSASLLYKIANIFEVSVEKFFAEFSETQEEPINAGFNILLVDDDIRDECIIRRAVSDFPAKINLYSVHGYEVLEFLRNTNSHYAKPDIVFLELHLFKFEGLNILKNLKRDKNFNSIPVVAITNSVNNQEVCSSYNLQVSGLIVKSCSFSGFQEQIHNALTYWTQLVKLPC